MNSITPNNVIPALVPPLGVTSNFVHPYSLSPAFVTTAVLCLLLATSAVIVRLAISFFEPEKKIQVEDYTSVVSWLGLVTNCVLITLEVDKGFGRHQWDVPRANMIPILKLLYVNRILYSPTILAAKLTILLQIMRIFAPTKRGLVFRLTQILIWLNASFYTANVLSLIFECNPIPKAWDPFISGACIDASINLILTSSINIVSDVLILLLPLWTIWHLKLPVQKKLRVSAVFEAGIFANVAGIMRLAYSVQMIRTSDITFLGLAQGMWTIAEITTATFCASLPLVPKFCNLFLRRRTMVIGSSTAAAASKANLGNWFVGSPRYDDEVDSGLEAYPLRFSSQPPGVEEGGREFLRC